jgi:hypothetical protein
MTKPCSSSIADIIKSHLAVINSRKSQREQRIKRKFTEIMRAVNPNFTITKYTGTQSFYVAGITQSV